MTADILGSMARLLAGQRSSIGALIGESEEKTSAGLRAVVPALLAGLVSWGADARGARTLLDRLGSNAIDPGLGSKLPGVLRSRGGFDALIDSGQGLLGDLIGGGRFGAVSDAISRASGIRSSSSAALLGMAAPLLFSSLKQHVIEGGLDASGLRWLLRGQIPMLQKMDLDPRILGAMGIPDVQEVLGIQDRHVEALEDARPRPRRRAPVDEPERRPGGYGWLIGAACAVLLAGVLWSLLGKPREASLSSADAALQSVYFEPGLSSLDGEDLKVIDSVADAMRASGRSVALTGSMARGGDARQNAVLAEQRVAAVREGLIARGVPELRIVAEPPVLSSDTERRAERVRMELRPEP